MINNLKSVNVETENIEQINVPINNVGNSKTYTEDSEFWKNNQVVLENIKIEFNVCE